MKQVSLVWQTHSLYSVRYGGYGLCIVLLHVQLKTIIQIMEKQNRLIFLYLLYICNQKEQNNLFDLLRYKCFVVDIESIHSGS